MKINRSLVGKVVKVRVSERGHDGAKTSKMTTIIGTCTFAGYNPYLGVQEVVVGRTPIYPVTEHDVTVV